MTVHALSHSRLQLLHFNRGHNCGRTIHQTKGVRRDPGLSLDIEFLVTNTLKDQDMLPDLNVIIWLQNVATNPRTVHIKTIWRLEILDAPGVFTIREKGMTTRDQRVINSDIRVVSTTNCVLTIDKVERLLLTPPSKDH